MSTLTDDPQSILLQNRTRTPTLEELTNQVNLLARLLTDFTALVDKINDLENSLLAIARNQDSNKQDRQTNSDFIVSTSRNALVFYTLELNSALAVSGSNDSIASLIVDGIITSSLKNGLNLSLILGVSISATSQSVLIGYIPIGRTANIQTSGSVTVVQALEVLL